MNEVERPEAGARGTGDSADNRPALLRRALQLEYATVGWNIVEGVVSVAFATAVGSIALLGFGIDSFVETASGGVLLWRLYAERRARDHEQIEKLDRRAHKIVGLSLFLLAGFVAFESVKDLVTRERPQPTWAGIVITAVSMVAMRWLARAKRQTALALSSRAMEADSFQTTACWWLSLITLAGIGLNATFGWWWADPVAALGMTYFLVVEGREAWKGEDCRDGGCA
jgi:divalent metal cation (Fe/Co/Zn/Cd) transporter